MSIFETISRPLFNGGVFRTDLLSDLYYFYCDFKTGSTPKDQISKELMQTTSLAAGRVSYHGGPYGINEHAVDVNGLFGCGVIENLVGDPEDTSQWSGSGPWTNTATVGTGTHTLSTDLDGATVSITAGTATIDGTATATYGNPDNFEVTGAGTVTIQTDTADPKAQITATEYKLPYVNGLSPENYSDADRGYKFPIDEISGLRDALDGVADGEELVVNGGFDTNLSSWLISNSGGDGGWEWVNGAVSKTDTTTTFRNLTQTTALILGAKYELVFDIVQQGTSDLILYYNGYDSNKTFNQSGTKTFRFTPSKQNITFFSQGAGTIIDNVSIKRVYSAKSKMTIKWRPMYNSGDLTGTINILTANDEATSFLLFDAENDLLRLTDGTNTSQVACVPVADTEYEITAQYDEANGMVISLDGTAGTTVAFAGRFPNADDLSYFWEAEVPQYVKITHIEKESGL